MPTATATARTTTPYHTHTRRTARPHDHHGRHRRHHHTRLRAAHGSVETKGRGTDLKVRVFTVALGRLQGEARNSPMIAVGRDGVATILVTMVLCGLPHGAGAQPTTARRLRGATRFISTAVPNELKKPKDWRLATMTTEPHHMPSSSFLGRSLIPPGYYSQLSGSRRDGKTVTRSENKPADKRSSGRRLGGRVVPLPFGMGEMLDLSSVAVDDRRLPLALWRGGWIAWWSQLILTAISTVTISFAATVGGGLASPVGSGLLVSVIRAFERGSYFCKFVPYSVLEKLMC